jgi:catechol 2,3-dioxygenase-like lactoylglutathione lyase family enzyme
MQLAADNGWNALVTGGTGSPENVPLQSEPIFSPTSLDYVLLNVADQEKAAGFYAKIFGPVTLRLDGQVWFNAGFSRIILRHTPSDQRVGVGRIGVSAAPFDPREMVKKLQYVGARVETPEVAGGLEFHDPDGLLVHVLHPIRD